MENSLQHTPVLLSEILSFVPLKTAKVIVDSTTGLGGHLEAMMKVSLPEAQFFAFDQDRSHLDFAKKRVSHLNRQCNFVHKNFVHLLECMRTWGETGIDFILFDLGLASPHVDLPTRGFSYKNDGPLDMRFDPESENQTAAEILNTLSFHELTHLFRKYGEEKKAHYLARLIEKTRIDTPFKNTSDLVELTSKLTRTPVEKNQMLKRIFQGLRIYVNNELEVLQKTLYDAISLLNVHGRIALISYHSLEDRIVKHTFKEFEDVCHCDPRIPICICQNRQKLHILTSKPIAPSPSEQETNPRSRSAKLRVAEKILL